MVNQVYYIPMTPTQHAEGLWTVAQGIRLPGIELPARSTILRLEGGGLLLLSPIPRIGEAAAEIARLGAVKAIAAPNLLHHLGLEPARGAFPEARVFARDGLRAKEPGLSFESLGDEPDPLWADSVDQLPIAGMKASLDEVAFFHRPSRALVLTDLCFHVLHSDRLLTRLFMRLNDSYGRFGPSRIMRTLIQDRAALRASLERMLAWDPERIVVAHGELIESEGRRALERAFSFL